MNSFMSFTPIFHPDRPAPAQDSGHGLLLYPFAKPLAVKTPATNLTSSSRVTQKSERETKLATDPDPEPPPTSPPPLLLPTSLPTGLAARV